MLLSGQTQQNSAFRCLRSLLLEVCLLAFGIYRKLQYQMRSHTIANDVQESSPYCAAQDCVSDSRCLTGKNWASVYCLEECKAPLHPYSKQQCFDVVLRESVTGTLHFKCTTDSEAEDINQLSNFGSLILQCGTF